MVRVLRTEVSKRLSLDEYAALISDTVDTSDRESIWESAWALRALANDRDFLLAHLQDSLKNFWPGDGRGRAQDARLAHGDGFYVRANIWRPDARRRVGADGERRAAGDYRIAHDHNFDFLTVGYFGPGYRTELYEYENAALTGLAGEKVRLHHLGCEQLSPGTVMMYLMSRDVHIQLPPERLSISLNLMCYNPLSSRTLQFEFDVDRSTISRVVSCEARQRSDLLALCADLHDDETLEILRAYADRHPSDMTRAQASSVMREIELRDEESLR